MGFKRRFKKKVKRKYKRKYKRRFAKPNKSPGRFISFPRTAKTVFHYADTQTFPAVGVLPAGVNQSYRLISVFDPNFTGTGIQPRYHDTLLGLVNTAAPYHRYRVYKAVVTATISNTSGASYIDFWGTMYEPPNTQPVDWSEAKERRYDTKTTTIAPIGQPGSIRTLKFIFTPKMLYQGLAFNDNDMQATANQNPLRNPIINFHSQARGTTSTCPECQVDVRIAYYTVLFEPNDVLPS